MLKKLRNLVSHLLDVDSLKTYLVNEEALKKLEPLGMPQAPHENRKWLLKNYPNSNFHLPSYPICRGYLPSDRECYIFIDNGEETDSPLIGPQARPARDCFFYPKIGKKYLYRYIP